MSALPTISAVTVALLIYHLTGSDLLAIGWWVFEIFISIPRDLMHTEVAPVLTYESWLPTHRGVHSIQEVVLGRLAGLGIGVMFPLVFGHFSAPLLLVGYTLLKKSEGTSERIIFVFCWLLSSMLLRLDQILIPSAIMMSLWTKSDPVRFSWRRAPQPLAASVTSVVITHLIGGSPGMNPALLTTITEGGPAWLMGFLECFLEAAVISKAMSGMPTSRGFMGVMDLHVTFASVVLTIACAAVLGILAIPLGQAIADSTAPYAEPIGWFFWACLLVIAPSTITHPAIRVISTGALLILRASAHRIQNKSGLLVPLPIPFLT